jgi:hypothetical protein
LLERQDSAHNIKSNNTYRKVKHFSQIRENKIYEHFIMQKYLPNPALQRFILKISDRIVIDLKDIRAGEM